MTEDELAPLDGNAAAGALVRARARARAPSYRVLTFFPRDTGTLNAHKECAHERQRA